MFEKATKKLVDEMILKVYITSGIDYEEKLGCKRYMKKWVKDTKLARKMYKDISDEYNGYILIGTNSPVKGSENCIVCSPKRVPECWRFILDNEKYKDYNVHSTTYVDDKKIYELNTNKMPLHDISHLLNKKEE